MAETRAPYALSRIVDFSFEEADRRIRDELKAEGFGVLTEIDVKATLADRLGVEMPDYEILGACSPPLAYRALRLAPDLGLLLPCNVVVRAAPEGGRTIIEAIDPAVQMEVAGNPELGAIAVEVRAKLERALDRAAGR